MLAGWKLFWAAPNWDISFVTSSFSLGFVKLWSTDGNENETKKVVTHHLKGMKCCLDQSQKSVLVWYYIKLSVWSGYRCQCLRGFLFWPNEQPTEELPISDCTYQIRLSTVFKNLNLTNPSWPESPAGWRFPRRDQVEFKFHKQKYHARLTSHNPRAQTRNVIRRNIRHLSTCRKSDTTIYIRLLPCVKPIIDDVRRSGSGWRCITL